MVLPFEHPLRLAEDAAVVDLLSDGRLELGVGSGSGPAEFQAFGVDMSTRHQLTSEGLAVLNDRNHREFDPLLAQLREEVAALTR